MNSNIPQDKIKHNNFQELKEFYGKGFCTEDEYRRLQWAEENRLNVRAMNTAFENIRNSFGM